MVTGEGLSCGPEAIVIAIVIVVRTTQECQKATFLIAFAIYFPPQSLLFKIYCPSWFLCELKCLRRFI